MSLGPTAELKARGAVGAAQHMLEAADTLEPVGRAAREGDEYERLLRLADRAVRRWIPLAVATLGQRRPDVPVPMSRIRSAADASAAAQQVGGLREILRKRRSTPTAAQPVAVAAALAQIQTGLRHVASAPPGLASSEAHLAVAHFGRGLVGCFYLGARFADGITGEVAATVRRLESGLESDQDPLTQGRERTASESALHRELIRCLMSELARTVGEITHADDGTLPRPPKVGRHRPDLVGRSPDGSPFIGEAERGPELFDPHTLEQLADFATHAPDAEPTSFHLIVPTGWRGEAVRALAQAAGSVGAHIVIHEVSGLSGAPSPPA
jgi:hypothetical protein